MVGISEKPFVPTKITEHVWTVYTPFRFMGVSIGNRMTLFEVAEGLFLVNGVELGCDLIDRIKNLEKETGKEVKWMVSPGDFHHMFIQQWLDCGKFPHLKAYVPEGRIQSANKNLFCETFNTAHLSPFEFSDDVEAIVFEGFKQPLSKGPRNEIFYYHKSSGALSVGDILLSYQHRKPNLSQRLFMKAKENRITPYPLGKKAFLDREKAIQSARRVLNLDIKIFIPLHGDRGAVCVNKTSKKIREAFESVLGSF